MKIHNDRLYMIDNGEVACGAHVGRTPKATGICRDGLPLITLAEVAGQDKLISDFWAEAICETCGKKESVH